MSASQNKKKTLSLGLALIPVISMLLLLIIGYGIMGLRIEPLLLCSAAVAAGIAWWQGYCWEDIINSVVDKLAKAMPVIMILICVGGLIGTWMFSGTIPYMVYWGLKLISPEYILIAAFFFNQRGLRLYRYIMGIRRDGWRCVNGGCRRAGRVSCSSSWRRCFWRLFRRQNLTVVRLD